MSTEPVDKHLRNRMEPTITNIFRQHLAKLKLDEYTFRVLFPGDEVWSNDGEDCVFSVERMYPYKCIRLHVSRFTIKNWDKSIIQDDLVSYLLHEAFHVVIWKLCTLAKDRCVREEEVDNEIESVTDHLANIWPKSL